jgi:hypothetical protein
MSGSSTSRAKSGRKEVLLALLLVLVGLLVLPAVIYAVGQAMFGEYGGAGFAGFYGELVAKLLSGELSVWFLVLSPYVCWQVLRFSVAAFKRAGDR